MSGCYVCGSREIVAGGHPHSPTCEACVPARGHVVSMRIGRDGSLVAACECGWRVETRRRPIREAGVRMHWRTVIRAVREAADAQPVCAVVAWLCLCGTLGAVLGGGL